MRMRRRRLKPGAGLLGVVRGSSPRPTGGVARQVQRYFRRITSFSVVVRRVLQDGDTAVLELRQTVRPRDWAVVLNRRGTGWQAVDLLTGNLAR